MASECETCGGKGFIPHHDPSGEPNPSLCPDCVAGLQPVPAVERLLRSGPGAHEGSIFGYRCTECGGWWKVYQSVSHMESCPLVGGEG